VSYSLDMSSITWNHLDFHLEMLGALIVKCLIVSVNYNVPCQWIYLLFLIYALFKHSIEVLAIFKRGPSDTLKKKKKKKKTKTKKPKKNNS
jgi:archaellum biogenesis protein FlaJ (TadC family)